MIVLIKGVYDYTLLDSLLLICIDNDDLVLGGCVALYGDLIIEGCMGRLDRGGAFRRAQGCVR